MWNRHSNVSYNPEAIGVLPQHPDALGSPRRELFLAWGYEENPPTEGGPRPVAADGWAGRMAARLARRWPGLVVSPGGELVRDDDPVGRLHKLAREAGDSPLLIVTPDRERTDPDRPLGPPSNPAHRREWSYDQFVLLRCLAWFAEHGLLA